MDPQTWDYDKLKNVVDFCCNNRCYRIGVELILSWLETKDINLLNSIKINLKKKEKNRIYYMLEKLTIMCYYVDEYRDLGYILSEILTFNNTETNQNNINMNKRFYIKQIKCKKYINISEKMDKKFIPILKTPKNGKKYYNPCNPSIIKTETGYICNCRFVNYSQEYAVHFEYLELDNIIRTKNVILIMDKNFNVKSSHKIIDDSWRNNCEIKHNVLGMEDCILFTHKNDVWVICTTLDTEPYGRPKQTIFKLPELYKDKNYHIKNITTMKSPMNQIEKNWMPISFNHEKFDKDTFYFIYKHKYKAILTEYNPNNACTIQIDENNNTIGINANIRISDVFNNNTDKTINYDNFRGSGGPVKIKFNNIDGYMSIIHEVIFTRQGRYYLHRFVYYDHDFSVNYITPLFYFDHLGIEFCRSMSLSHINNEIIVTVGIEDKEARIYCLDFDMIKNMLIDINDITILK